MTTAPTSPEVPTLEQLLRRIEETKPILAANVDETEANRRIAQANIDALIDVGAFKVTIPRRFGGYEMTIREKLEVSAAVAEACGSTGWVVALTNVCNWMAGVLPDQAQQDIFGDNPDARVAGVLNPSADVRKVQGGYQVSGQWPWASGSWHADWALVGIVVPDETGQPVDQALAFIPMSELSIRETWFVAGMRGTGSNTIIAEDVFVPGHRLHSVPRAIENEYATEHTDEALYRSSFIPVLTLILAGPQLGLGRAALRFVMEKAPKRGISYTRFERQIDSTAFQLQIANAATLLDTAHLHVWRAAGDIDGAAAAGEPLPYVSRARVRADTAYAITKVREAIDLLLSAHGASSFAEASPLQRIWRDSNTAARHAVVDPLVNQEVYGKALLGIPYEENITPLI
ncbi:MAG TPA: acyl-CoA dehydrogenase family protein [Solirubrobacteraceae bacterium]|nr:acyl-CoA dehydrogenase family protein [Solirubrobacteraceae bacterium]